MACLTGIKRALLFSLPLLSLASFPLATEAKTAKYGTYNFTFFLGENCEGDTNGESMVGEVADGEMYCMNFTQPVLSMLAEFTNLTDAKGDAIDGVGLMYRTQQDQSCGTKTEVPVDWYYGPYDEWHCWAPKNGACHAKMSGGLHYFFNGGVSSGASCHSY